MTPEQKLFLQDELVRYSSMSTKEYAQLWLAFFQQWSQHWPERAAMFLELPSDAPLTPQQQKDPAKAVAKRQQVSDVSDIHMNWSDPYLASMAVATLACGSQEEQVCQQEDVDYPQWSD